MPRSALTGSRIRERRTAQGLRQSELAARVEISPSYLNLIEHNRRRIAGKLLTRIARALAVDVSVLTQGAETEQLDQMGAAAAAHPDVAVELDRVDELVGRYPGWSALIATQARRIAALEARVIGLADRLAHDPFLSASLHDLLSRVAAIQSTASILVETEDLDDNWRKRFERNLHDDSARLATGAAALVGYLDAEGEPELGVVTPQEELEAFLNATGFHVAALEGSVPDLIDRIVRDAPALQSDAGRALARAYLRRYRAEALAMPLAAFAAAAQDAGHDPARLAAQFGQPMGAVFRRLASLPDAGIGLVVCDGSGALTLRKTTPLLPVPRFGSACALWPLYRALAQPMAPLRVVLEHAARPDERFVCFAMAQPAYPEGFAGPAVHESAMLVVPPELVAPGDAIAPLGRIGTSCRVCPLDGCPARREPSILGDAGSGASAAALPGALTARAG
ncbi:helix-turn-helix domain-containing protein [Meridianimarinicoccus sp. RP-17]|uniref:helix-turn-helix domain-containing protein n=1 Tax=Meridianimarinicoccus zhengii TaxID=2056810 RepID=UPI000DAB896B|nr:helix-turn-helix transcriptional regulator [Phycocomes zhengii]